MRGRLQFCRRSRATRNRLDPWSLPLFALAQRRALTRSLFSAPRCNSARAKDRALAAHHRARVGIAEEHAEKIGVRVAELWCPRHAAVRGPEDRSIPAH